MKDIPVFALLSIIFGLIVFIWPHLIPYLVPLYMVLSGIGMIFHKK